jgi:tetratricopeptide (TPR) repeat protein
MDDQVRELVALGKEHFQRGDYSLAAGNLEAVVARGAAFADVHHMLGVIYHHLGEFDSAQRAFAKALEINPNYVEAALNLAIVCNDLGQYERAQQVYGDALARARSKQPREPNGDEALDSYTKGKIANLHAAVGDGYLSVRRPSDAAAEYRRALSLCPTFLDLRLKLGSALREAGDRDGSLAEYRIAVQHAPAYIPARVALGTALYAGGKLDEAVAQWEEVLRMDPSHRTAAMYLKMARSPQKASR